jgi:cytidylate kinase
VGRREIITIDGPAGAGKSTLGRRLAQALGYLYIDSGAFYRAVAWQATRLGLDLSDTEALGAFLESFQPEVLSDHGGFHLFIAGVDVSKELRGAWVSREASRVAALPRVRQWVKERLQYLARDGGIVAEGRDQGTAVFPQAEYKFFLNADLETRAARRRQDFEQAGSSPPLEEVIGELAARDRQDETRAEAPLIVPPGAIVIDTTRVPAEEVMRQCLARIRSSQEPGRQQNKPGKSV